MAYQFLVPAAISDLINGIGVLAQDNGWQLIVQDNNVPVLGAVTSGGAVNPRTRATVNNLSLLSVARGGSLGRVASVGTIAQTALMGTRLVLKDPNGAYFHVFGYSNLTGWIDGQSAQSLSFLELWISDEFSGASNPIYSHGGLAKLGVGGPYRATFEGCHLFTGQNQYNNKLYFNLAVETSAGRFEHFSFGSIETYFNMACGEFWQASGQAYGTYYYTSYGPPTAGSHTNGQYGVVNTIWGGVNGSSLPNIDLSWSDGNIALSGTSLNSSMPSSTVIRYSIPNWNRDKAFLCSSGFTTEPSTATVGRTNEFMLPPYLLAGVPVMTLTPNGYSGVSVFAPAYIGAFSPLEAGYWGLIGQYPNQRICNLANNNPKDVVIYGTDEWMLFPLASKGDTTYNGTWPVISGNYGVAYRK